MNCEGEALESRDFQSSRSNTEYMESTLNNTGENCRSRQTSWHTLGILDLSSKVMEIDGYTIQAGAWNEKENTTNVICDCKVPSNSKDNSTGQLQD